jgi:RND family efflux transporter MFP subunit
MDAEARMPGIAVEARTATSASLIGDIEASGLIRGVAEAWVISETQGVIESVSATLGEEVIESRPMVTFDRGLQELQLRQAQSRLESARLDLAATERLYEGGNASMAELAAARSAAAGAEASVESARRALEHRTIRAPIAGRIADIADGIARGNYLTTGNRVARVIDTTRLQVEVALGEQEIQYVRRGGDALVTVPACGAGPVEATVVALAAASDPATGSFPVVVEWANECGNTVRAGMSASVAIKPDDRPRVLIPANAVVAGVGTADGSGDYVFIAEDDVAHRRRVELGRRAGNAVEIRSGVEPGEVVITSGLSRLSDNDSIIVTLIGDTGGMR